VLRNYRTNWSRKLRI